MSGGTVLADCTMVSDRPAHPGDVIVTPLCLRHAIFRIFRSAYRQPPAHGHMDGPAG
jgi:hypothetical protein